MPPERRGDRLFHWQRPEITREIDGDHERHRMRWSIVDEHVVFERRQREGKETAPIHSSMGTCSVTSADSVENASRLHLSNRPMM